MQSDTTNRGFRIDSFVDEYGVTGVFKCKQHGGWIAHMRVDGKYVHLGRHDTKEDAAEARRKAQIGNGFHKNHGARTAVPKYRSPDRPPD